MKNRKEIIEVVSNLKSFVSVDQRNEGSLHSICWSFASHPNQMVDSPNFDLKTENEKIRNDLTQMINDENKEVIEYVLSNFFKKI